MFGFLKKNKEYISCEWLEYGIHFTTYGIQHCCQFFHSNNNDEAVSILDKDEKYNLSDFLKKKAKVRKMHRKGILNKRCIGCFELNSRKWDEDFQIRRMAIGTSTRCNCNCIYCYTHNAKKFYNNKKDIPIYDVLVELFDKKLIHKECEISFNSGEPVIIDDFERIINLFIKNGINKIRISSSGIKYSDIVETSLKKGVCDLIISPDSANNLLYKKIKCVDKFDILWANIEKYAKAQCNTNQVQLKYIIIPNVNDKKEYIKEFVDRVREVGVKKILIDIEMWWYRNNNNEENIKKIFELVKYMEEYIAEQKLYCSSSIILASAFKKYPEICEKIGVSII